MPYSLARRRWIYKAHVYSDIKRHVEFTWELLEHYGIEEKAIDLMRKYIADMEPDELLDQWSDQFLRRHWKYYRQVEDLKVVKVKSKA